MRLQSVHKPGFNPLKSTMCKRFTLISFCILIFLLTFFLGSDIDAQIDSVKLSYFEMPIEELLDFEVITSSKIPRMSSEITQKVDIVTKQQISQTISGNRNIAELIQYLPGAAVKVLSRNDANWGAYGGIGPKYNTFMVQGLPVDAYIDPQSLESMAIKHIEVQRGPASVLYPNYLSQDFAGNQSPLAGTVNLILKEKIDASKTMVSLSYGSFNTLTGKAYHENNFGRVHVFGGISYERSDYTNYGSEGSWLNMIKNPEYKKGKAFLGGTIFLDENEDHKITFFGNKTWHLGDFGRTNRKYDFDYGLLNFSYSGKLTKTLELTLKTGLRQYDREYEEDNYDTINFDESLKETLGVKQLIVPTDLSLTYRHFYNSNLTVGADYQHATYSTWEQPVMQEKTTGNDAAVSQIGFYLQEELQINKFVFRGGMRYNIINYNIEKIGGEIPGSKKKEWHVFLWSVGAKYKISDELAFFSNAGNSFMSPGLKSIGGTIPYSEKFNPGSNGQLPNPDLMPESGLSIDLGLDYKLPWEIYLSARAFSTKLTDAILDIVISEDPSQTISVNAEGKTLARGFELSLKQQIESKIEWFANLTYIKSEIEDPNNPDQDGVEVPFVPKLVSNIGGTFYFPHNIETCVWMHFGGKIFDSSSKADRNSFYSGEVINLLVSKKINFRNNTKLDVFAKIYNLTNNEFIMPWQFQDTGFSFSLGTRIVF